MASQIKFQVNPPQDVAVARPFERAKLETRQQLMRLRMGDRAAIPMTESEAQELLSKVAEANKLLSELTPES